VVVVRSSRRRARIDYRAVRQGALLGLFVIVPATIAQEVLLAAVDDPCNDPVVFPIFLIIMGAFFLAGHRAARGVSDSPYTHAVLGALGALGVWLPIRMVKNLLFGGAFVSDDCGTDGTGFLAVMISIVTVALMAMSVGILGGMVASRRRPGDG
jgi:hypothetical protein